MELLQYYGLDWLAMALSVLAVYLLGVKNRMGFVSFLLANLIWMVVGISLMKSFGIAIGNGIFFILNLKGYLSWNKSIKPESVSK